MFLSIYVFNVTATVFNNRLEEYKDVRTHLVASVTNQSQETVLGNV